MLLLFKLYLILNILVLSSCTSLDCHPGIINYKLHSCSTIKCIQERSYDNVIDLMVPGFKCKFF